MSIKILGHPQLFRRKWHSFPPLKKHSTIKCVDTFSRDHKTLRQKKRKTILISHRKTTSNNLDLDLNCHKRMLNPFLAGESQYLPVAPMTRKATLTRTMSTWTQRPKLLWGIFCFLRKVWKLLWGILCFPSESFKPQYRQRSTLKSELFPYKRKQARIYLTNKIWFFRENKKRKKSSVFLPDQHSEADKVDFLTFRRN